MCKLGREVLGKSGSEHNDELRPKSQYSPCPLNWVATRVSQARHFAFYKVANVQRCLDCRRKCLHEVVRVPSWAWEGRPWVVVRPFWLLSLLSGRWARVSSPPPLAQMTAHCCRSRTSSRLVDGVVVWCFVVRRKAACLVVESCKSGRKERAQRQRGRLSRTVQSRTAEKGKVKSTGRKVGRWNGHRFSERILFAIQEVCIYVLVTERPRDVISSISFQFRVSLVQS